MILYDCQILHQFCEWCVYTSSFSDDWTPEPEFIATLRKPALRNLAKRIARLWRDLSRKIKEDVKDNTSLYSIIYVPNGFVVPGGKFSHHTVSWKNDEKSAKKLQKITKKWKKIFDGFSKFCSNFIGAYVYVWKKNVF